MDTLAPSPRKLNSDLSWQINISTDQNSGPGLFIIWLEVWAEEQDEASPLSQLRLGTDQLRTHGAVQSVWGKAKGYIS